jgi:hypothetical protein
VEAGGIVDNRGGAGIAAGLAAGGFDRGGIVGNRGGAGIEAGLAAGGFDRGGIVGNRGGAGIAAAAGFDSGGIVGNRGGTGADGVAALARGSGRALCGKALAGRGMGGRAGIAGVAPAENGPDIGPDRGSTAVDGSDWTAGASGCSSAGSARRRGRGGIDRVMVLRRVPNAALVPGRK